MCVIELAGLPGAGKTSVARVASQRSNNVDLKVPNLNFIYLVAHHPVRFAQSFARWVSLRRDWSDKRALARLIRRQFRYDTVSRVGKAAPCLLLEEGLVHSVWRELFLKPSLEIEPWENLFKGHEPTVVLINLPSRIAAHRIAIKEHRGPINEQLVQADDDQWVRAVDLYNLILQQVPHVTVQGIENMETVARRVEWSMCTSHRSDTGDDCRPRPWM